MSSKPHPIDDPPPPGLAERLVARSGFAVYESGTNLFDESVLVYVARSRQGWPEFDIYDHVGRPLGCCRNVQGISLHGKPNGTVYYDHDQNEILRVTYAGQSIFDVTGLATGRVVSEWNQMGNMVISANNEPYGQVIGPRYRGLTASSLRILNERQTQVGAVKVLKEGRWLNSLMHHVVSVEAGLRGELRRLVVAVPTMVAVIKQQQSS